MRKRDENGQHPLFHIPVASSHQQIDVVADGTLQVISGDSITRLQVTDNGFNRRTLPALFPLLVLLVPGILLNGWKMIPQILARVSLMQASTMDHLDQVASTNLFQTNSIDESYCYVLAFLITISTRKHMDILTFLVVMIMRNKLIYK